jgi:ATP-dependent Clp protease ATP-binding subunit ClpB
MIGKIADLRLSELSGRLAERGVSLKVEPKAKDFIAAAGYDKRFGARPLKRAIQSLLENPLALKLLSGEMGEGDEVAAKKGREGIEFEVGKGAGNVPA